MLCKSRASLDRREFQAPVAQVLSEEAGRLVGAGRAKALARAPSGEPTCERR